MGLLDFAEELGARRAFGHLPDDAIRARLAAIGEELESLRGAPSLPHLRAGLAGVIEAAEGRVGIPKAFAFWAGPGSGPPMSEPPSVARQAVSYGTASANRRRLTRVGLLAVERLNIAAELAPDQALAALRQTVGEIAGILERAG